MVVLSHGSLSFEDLNGDRLLVVLVGREGLRFLGWDDSSSWDDLGHHSSDSFNTKGKWSDVDDEHSFSFLRSFSTKNSCLDCSTVSDSFIRVDSSVWLFSVEEIFNELLNLGDSCRSSDKNNLIDVTLLLASVFKCLLNRL
mmetsp:Transcript_24074/g.27775  ORF Transcript_24074/g.27775 Transcript_24074/m.27775 type:complete len:141 (+) Transcript_24074:592-1014(+)